MKIRTTLDAFYRVFPTEWRCWQHLRPMCWLGRAHAHEGQAVLVGQLTRGGLGRFSPAHPIRSACDRG